MNKKLLLSVSLVVMAAIILLWGALRLSPLGQSHSLSSEIIIGTLKVLALPMRLYVIFVLGENGHWSPPLLILFLTLSGLMWGLIVERVWTVIARRKSIARKII
jgi:hypothetical protein